MGARARRAPDAVENASAESRLLDSNSDALPFIFTTSNLLAFWIQRDSV